MWPLVGIAGLFGWLATKPRTPASAGPAPTTDAPPDPAIDTPEHHIIEVSDEPPSAALLRVRKALPDYAQYMSEALAAAAEKYHLDPLYIGSFAFWESDFGRGLKPPFTGTGDGGHAHSPWQLDDHWHAAFINSQDMTDPMVTTDYAVGHVIVPLAKRYGAGTDEAIGHYNGPAWRSTVTPFGNYVDAVRAKWSVLKKAAAEPDVEVQAPDVA